MAFNNNDLNKGIKSAKSAGYDWSSDKTKMITDKNEVFKVSSSGGSVTLKGSTYTSLADLNKSKKWG